MSDAGLNIVIGADVKSAVAGLDQVSASLENTSAAAGAVSPALSKAVDGVNKIISPTKEASITIADMRDKLKDLKAQLETTTGGQNIQKLNVQIKGLEDAIHSATTVAQPAHESFEKIRTVFEDVGRVAEGGGLSIRGFAQNFALVGPAVAIAVAAIAKLGPELYEYINASTAAEEAQKILNKTLGESAGDTKGEITAIQDLVAIIGDETQSRQVHSDAFKQLQDQYPNAFKNMSLEKTSMEDLKIATDHLTEALIRQAQIKGVESAISDIAKKQADLANQSETEFISGLNIFDKLKVIMGGVGVGFGAATEAGKLFGEQVEKNDAVADALNKKLKDLITTGLKLGDNGILGSGGTNTKTIQDQNLQYLEKTKNLIEGLSKRDNKPLFEDFKNSAEGGLADINYGIYIAELKKATQDAAKGAISADTFSSFADALKAAFEKTAAPNIKSNIDFQVDNSNQAVLGQKIQTVVGKLDKYAFVKIHFDTNSLAGDLDKLTKSLDDILTNFKGDLVAGIAEGIGTALGSGGNVLTAAIDEVEQIIGDALERLGKALIAYGIAKEAVDISFKSLNGYVAIAAGIAAVIAGAALKATATGGAHAFAEGGIITGPTLGLVGEAGPEVIFPLSKLNQFIQKNTTGNSGMNVHVTGEIQGSKLILVHDRARNLQKKV